MLYITGAVLLALTLGSVVYRRRQRRDGDTARAIGRDMAAGAAIFAFVGPPVGIAVIALFMAVVAWSSDGLMFGIFGLPWAYIFGIVPAMFCGLTAGALKPLTPSWLAILRMGAIGAVYAFAFLLTFGGRDLSWSSTLFPLYMGAVPAAVAGLACARLLYGKPAPAR
ncbi:hypothetical protein [Achromobacter sp. NFACC18-2]|uniref:hypothetical protein n=1 Tax=Achromobacter sp. NFACC18-2 TaxID=1564112 RepID=UPI0008BF4A54|nr:hypothetical protein [Achromobacter sp. NFACC18-2]SEJ10247.1 hypothetical protein SAMN03159494_01677 [Achromobacter sp. NFACC18-2]